MLAQFKTIGVIGAGTMGIGIAEVAASKNQQVLLFDLNNDFAKAAKNTMEKRLNSRVARGKITQEHCQSIVDNISVVDELEKLTDCQLVLEAIIENLKIKQNLFNDLQEICNENTLFASNTSSISITAIASVLKKPENMIGLHFFNPAPVMKLVEVIAGLRSSKENLDTGVALCEFWNKVPVLAQSSPGFIVNRVARPFYGEALKMLQEQLATPETIDALITSAGFRMGPFTLMDLIGMDINLSVSQTVFASMYYDPRYRPSLVQSEMVSANLLGKKTGQGFYSYDGSEKPAAKYEPNHQSEQGTFIGENDSHFNSLLSKLKPCNEISIKECSDRSCIQIDNCAIVLTNGQTSQQRAIDNNIKYLAQIDLSLDYESCSVIHLSFSKDCHDSIKNKVVGSFQKIGKKVIVSDDVPALVVMRTVCLLINEAADAIENGVCSEKDVDLAMQKGVNYPIGLIDWANRIGIRYVVNCLDNLHNWFGDDKYRTSTWLRKRF